MLTLLHHTTDVHQCQFSLLEALLAEPFPRTPEDLLQLEQRLSTAAGAVADQDVLVGVTRGPEEEGFVKQAVAPPRAQKPGPPVPQGLRPPRVPPPRGARPFLKT